MLFNGNLTKPVAGGLLALTTVFHPITVAQEITPEPDYSYVVSVQDMSGQDLCNGVYVGGNLVMLHSGCETNAFPFPINPINTPVTSLSNPLSVEGKTIELNGEAVKLSQLSVNGVDLNSADIQALYGDPSNQLDETVSGSAFENAIDPGAPDFDYSDDEYGLNLIGPGQPSQVVFTDRDGVTHPPVRVKRRVANPYTSERVMIAVETVPANVSNIHLASYEQIESLQATERHPLTLVTRGLDGKIVLEDRYLAKDEECNSFPLPIGEPEVDPLAKNVCIKGAPVFCGITLPSSSSPALQPELGAPFIAQLANGESVVVAQRTPSCDRYPAASNYQPWANLHYYKAQGLQTAVAYDLGERDVLENPYLNIRINNESADQKFDVFDADLIKDDGFRIIANSCGTLEPGDSCAIKLKADVSDAVSMRNLLALKVNGDDAGIYASVDGIAHRFVKGDSGALWKLKGWKVAGLGLFGQTLYTNAEITRNPSLTRTRYEVNPESISVTYKLEGDSTFGAALFITRQQLGATSFNGFINSGMHTLPGTNGEWVTKTIALKEPGAYSMSISRFIYPIDEADEFDMTVKSICFGVDCDL